MLPEIGATELLVIAAVALIVVGPKDLPALLRKLGQFVAKLRDMAAEFRASFDEMARQSELDDLRKEVEAMRRGQFVDKAELGAGEVDQVFEDISRGLGEGTMQLHPPMGHQYAEVQALPPAQPEAPAKPKRARAARPKETRIVEGGPKPRKPAAKAATKPATKQPTKTAGKPRKKAESAA